MNKKQNRRNSLRRIKKLYVRFTHLHSRQPLNVNYGHSVLLAAMFSHFSANKNLLESNSMSRKSTFSMHKWAISIYLYSCVQTKHGKFLSIASRVCTRDSIVFLEISFLLLKWIKTEAGRVTVSIVRNENYAVQTSSIILSIISLLNEMIVFLLGHYSATFYDFNDENVSYWWRTGNIWSSIDFLLSKISKQWKVYFFVSFKHAHEHTICDLSTIVDDVILYK